MPRMDMAAGVTAATRLATHAYNYSVETGTFYLTTTEGQAALWATAAATKAFAADAGKGAVRFVVSTMALGWASNITYWFTPNFRLPGFTAGESHIGTFNFGGVDWGEIKMPSFNQESVEGFSKSLLEVGEGIGNAGGKPIAIVGGVILSVYAAYTVNNFALHYVKEYATHTMGRPTLSRKFMFDDWQGKLYSMAQKPVTAVSNLIFGEKKKVEPKAPIFNPEIQEQLNDIVFSLKNVQKNKGTYENVILYGPPGTGKTMTAQYIAENCGMNFMEISGGDVAKFIGTKSPPVEELNKVFGRINSSSKPTILFIDEFDGFATDRNRLDTPRVEILNAFLNLTGTPSSKFLIISATNRVSDLDPAIHSRFGDRIYMGPPATKERLTILKMYVDEFFTEDADKAVFSDTYLDKLNTRLEGKTGRTLYKLMNKCHVKKNQQADGRLSEELVDKTLTRFLENEKQMQVDAG